VDCHATGIQLHRNCAPLWLRPHPADQRKGSGPTCHATGTPVTTCEKLHRHSRQCCASSTAEPVPRLEVALRRTQQCQLKVTATGGQPWGRHDGWHGQKRAGSNCSGRRAKAAVKSPAGSRPLLKRRESPLPRREDDSPVPRSSNGSHAQRAPRELPVPSH
jgi:hypothetical protein